MSLRSILVAAAVGAGLSLAAAADAALLSFQWSNGGEAASWVMEAEPTPLATTAGGPTIAVTAGSYDGFFGSHAVTTVTFYPELELGGFSIPSADGTNQDVATIGAAVFAGTLAAPVFAPGSFQLHDLIFGGFGTLTITVVPEPASLPLLASGLFALAMLGFRAPRR